MTLPFGETAVALSVQVVPTFVAVHVTCVAVDGGGVRLAAEGRLRPGCFGGHDRVGGEIEACLS